MKLEPGNVLFRGYQTSFIFDTEKSTRRFFFALPLLYQLYQLKAPGHDSGQNGIHGEHNNWHGAAVPQKVEMRPIPPHSDLLALPICTSKPPTLRRAPAIKPSLKHHVKLSNRSLFHPK